MAKNGLDMAALRELDGDLADVLTQGLRMEVLSWRLTLEEPQGCNHISQAFNMGNEIALATSEATAIATLSDTITFAIANSKLTASAQRKIAFETVKTTVAAELQHFVTQEAFLDMFDFVMNMGANNGPWIPTLVAMARKVQGDG